MRQFQLRGPDELQTARNYLEKLSFRDGAATAHGHARSVKSNEEMDSGDPVARELSAWFATRIMQHPNTQGLVFPKTLTRPIVSRTSGGGHYGLHTDLTQLQDIQGRQMCTDLSFTLFLSDPATLPELSRCLQSGAVPVAPTTKLLKNYDPNQENGNAFLYEALTHWQAFAAVVRALETYRFPYDWKTIQKEGMEA